MPDLGELYAAARHRITDLLMTADVTSYAQPCPATPEWTVHDVLAHVRGVTEDVRLGNLDGVATDPWTAAQVARHRETSVADLLAGWGEDAPLLEAFLSSPMGDAASRAVIDAHAHEGDLRSALGRPAVLNGEFAAWALPPAIGGLLEGIDASGKPALRIVTHEGDDLGRADAPVVLTTGRFELFRTVLGRRSPAQVLAFDWDGSDGSPYLEHLFMFGPRETPLVE